MGTGSFIEKKNLNPLPYFHQAAISQFSANNKHYASSKLLQVSKQIHCKNIWFSNFLLYFKIDLNSTGSSTV